jgi:hypothetical protein
MPGCWGPGILWAWPRFTGSCNPWPAKAVSHELAARLDGAVLDFGRHNRMQRFVWAALPAVKGPQCTCLRSMGKPAGKRSPCLDDAGVGITDL